MSEWHSRAELRKVAYELMGHDDYQRERHQAMEPLVNQLWEHTQDVKLFSWYDTPTYVYSCIDCFCDFTKSGVQSLARWYNEKIGASPYDRAVDLGAGIGASSRLFHELTGVQTTAHFYSYGLQHNFAKKIGVTNRDVDRVEVGALLRTKPDIVMAFEFFEHVQNPFTTLRWLTDETKAAVLCCANSFTQVGDLGHWTEYEQEFEGPSIDRKAMGRAFGKWMRDHGWKNEDTGFWNGRPQIWTRGEG